MSIADSAKFDLKKSCGQMSRFRNHQFQQVFNFETIDPYQIHIRLVFFVKFLLNGICDVLENTPLNSSTLLGASHQYHKGELCFTMDFQARLFVLESSSFLRFCKGPFLGIIG